MACSDSDGCFGPGMCLIKCGEASVLAAPAGGGGRVRGERPFPDRPEGANCLPQVDHILVLMMENHSYDNYLGMLGRRRGGQPRGDGFTLGPDGLPTAANPAPDGGIQHAFRMPTTCQLSGKPSQEWEQAHNQFNGGRNTSILAMVERKWNLPAMTHRDAAAADLTDFLNLDVPQFAEPPTLAHPPAGAAQLACEKAGPGQIPPPGSVTPP
jgi:phospholipase C